MGVLTIETNQTINLSQYGLKAGDLITVTCIGGGAGGYGAGKTYDTSSTSYNFTYQGGAGGDAGCPGGGSSGGGGGAGAGYGAGGGGAANVSYYSYNGGYNSGTGTTGGTGGGSGECKMTTVILNATTVNSVAITVGAGGIGGKWSSYTDSTTATYSFTRYQLSSPTNGGVTSFGTILSANGGIIGRGGIGGNNSGGGGAGGYLFPQKIYGGQGGHGGQLVYCSTNSVANTGVAMQSDTAVVEMLRGAGGGGGAAAVYNSPTTRTQLGQQSEFGGAGGAKGQSGGYGIMSKGHGAVIILWD